MYASPAYPEVGAAEVEAFVREQFCGKVLAVDADGFPRASILPFLRTAEGFEVHMVQEDPTFQALRLRGRGSFLLDESLAFTPHHVVDERMAGYATLHFRAVLFRVEAEVATDPAEVAAALQRLVQAYEPQAAWEPVADGPTYGAQLRRLAVARLRVVGTDAKFKLAQNRTPEERARLLAFLQTRGLPLDALAAQRIREANRMDDGRAAEALPGGH